MQLQNRLDIMMISTVVELPEVSTVIALPETLHDRAVEFVESHRGWDYDRMMAAALILFLAQQKPC